MTWGHLHVPALRCGDVDKDGRLLIGFVGDKYYIGEELFARGIGSQHTLSNRYFRNKLRPVGLHDDCLGSSKTD